MKTTRTVIISALGFIAGWLSNDWLSSSSSAIAPSAQQVSPSVLRAPVENGVSAGGAVASVEQNSPSSQSDFPESETYRSDPATADSGLSWQEARLKQAADRVDEFKALIESGDYEQAVLYYSRHRHLADVEALLRSVLRNSLQAFGDNGQTERFAGLADAWLTSYYSDAEILLLVAKQHRSMDYVQEALNVLQLAMTYSDGSEKTASYKALQEFIQDTDSELSRESAWSRLQSFYEALRSMGLDSAEDRLRLAEVYLFSGKENAGRELLLQLANNAQLASRAQSILQRYDAGAGEFKPLNNRKKQFTSRLSMKSMGRHYLLPLLAAGGAKVELLLDTGASTTLITHEAFQRFTGGSEVRYLGPRIFNTANGVSRGNAYQIKRVTFGPFELQNLEVSVSDVDFGGQFDGLLGMNVLQQFSFQIDQTNSELLLNPR